MDRRGAGLNRPARGDAPSVEALLGDLDAVVRAAAARRGPLHLAGFCWGSVYAVNFLADSSLRVDGAIHVAPSLFPAPLVLGRPFATGDSGEATEEPVMPIERFTDGPSFESFIVPDPLRLRWVSPRMNACMQRLSAGIWMKFLRLDLPCLMILGERDAVVDDRATRRAFERLAVDRKRLHALDSAHGIQFDAPQAAAALVRDWVLGLARADAPSAPSAPGAGDAGRAVGAGTGGA